MNIILDGVDQETFGIWRTYLLPREISVFGDCSNSIGQSSIIVLFDPETIYDEESGTLNFDQRFTTLVNKGNTTDTLIIQSLEFELNHESGTIPKGMVMNSEGKLSILINDQSFFQLPPKEKIALKEGTSDGDRDFIRQLVKYEKAGTIPTELRELGQKLLYQIRNHHYGSLKFQEKTKRYVETPVFIWAVKIQPRAKSLRIIVKGSLVSFKTLIDKKIKDFNDDMTGYSAFTISKKEQIGRAVSIILKAFENRRK